MTTESPTRNELEVSPTRRRIIAVGFLVILAVAGLLNSIVKRHDLAGISGLSAAVSQVTMSGKASSNAWYCPGPLALGHRGERSAVSISNVTSKSLTAQIHIALNSGRNRSESSLVSAYHQNVVALPQPKTATYGALTVVVNGPGVGVNELTYTTAGVTTSPCTTHTSPHVYFGVGSTSGLSNIAVSLYNPGATPAVANLAFVIGGSTLTPAAFSSVPVEPGQDIVLFAAHVLPQRKALSAVVTTVSGELAVGDLNFKDDDNVLNSSLSVGTPIARPSWIFAPTVVSHAIHETFNFVNPTTKSLDVDLRLLGTGADGVTVVSVPAQSASQFNVPPVLRPGIEGASVHVVGSGSVVVEREIYSGRHISLSGAQPGASLPGEFPPGAAVTAAGVAPTDNWLIAGGASSGSSSEVIGIVNPNSVPVSITLRQLFDGSAAALPHGGKITVGPHRSASVNIDAIVENRSALALILGSSKPVIAGATEFGLTKNGLSAPAPLPIG